MNMYPYSVFLCFFASFLLIPVASGNCLDSITLYNSPANDETHWGYTNLLGPLNWANLDPKYCACATSKFQSPINLNSFIPFAEENPAIFIPSFSYPLMSHTHGTIQVLYERAPVPSTKYENEWYRFLQFHFHTPSEHRIDEEFFVLEMHMVHENIGILSFANFYLLTIDKPSSRLVLTALFELSDASSLQFMDEIVAALPEVVEPDTSTRINGSINLAPIIEVMQHNSTHNYVYQGSLTTPPCDEGVTFIITNQTFPLSIKQFIEMKKVIKFNSRYTQNIPGDENLLLLPRKCINSENHDEKLFSVQ